MSEDRIDFGSLFSGVLVLMFHPWGFWCAYQSRCRMSFLDLGKFSVFKRFSGRAQHQAMYLDLGLARRSIWGLGSGLQGKHHQVMHLHFGCCSR